jgi:hypothetical protein
MTDPDRKGLLGFAFRRKLGSCQFEWLNGMKVFPSPAPKEDGDGKQIECFPTNKNPIQSFLWSDYAAEPG